MSLGPDNRSRGYGTVLLATAEDAGRAIDMFNGYDWQTRILEVRVDRVGGIGMLNPTTGAPMGSMGGPMGMGMGYDPGMMGMGMSTSLGPGGGYGSTGAGGMYHSPGPGTSQHSFSGQGMMGQTPSQKTHQQRTQRHSFAPDWPHSSATHFTLIEGEAERHLRNCDLNGL